MTGRPDTEPRFLSVAAVAASLSLSEKTIRRLVADRELPAVKVAGRLRIDAAGVEAFLERSRVVPAARPSPDEAARAARATSGGRPGVLAAALDRLDGDGGLDGDPGGA